MPNMLDIYLHIVNLRKLFMMVKLGTKDSNLNGLLVFIQNDLW